MASERLCVQLPWEHHVRLTALPAREHPGVVGRQSSDCSRLPHPTTLWAGGVQDYASHAHPQDTASAFRSLSRFKTLWDRRVSSSLNSTSRKRSLCLPPCSRASRYETDSRKSHLVFLADISQVARPIARRLEGRFSGCSRRDAGA